MISIHPRKFMQKFQIMKSTKHAQVLQKIQVGSMDPLGALGKI